MGHENDPEVIFDFGVFKAQFALALERTEGLQWFSQYIEGAEDREEVEKAFKNHKEEIAYWLGIDLEEECENCADMEDEIDRLSEMLENNDHIVKSVQDEYKLTAFAQHKDDYSIEELEYLFHNGKMLIEKTKNW